MKIKTEIELTPEEAKELFNVPNFTWPAYDSNSFNEFNKNFMKWMVPEFNDMMSNWKEKK